MEDDAVQIAAAILTYLLAAAILVAMLHNLPAALVTLYMLALAARTYTPNTYTRTLLVIASALLIPTTPLLTSQAPIRIPLPLHTLLVYTPHSTHTTTHVLALDWGQIGLLTLALELKRKARKG
ncbi:hypothetical protein Pyrfu_0093 [Pyrolobus fumarii 1A]|uniref:Uncharacterized protein n=1 Tax=Pyrolobus fumarii (strain DSM 11204 / 1A) TaxID=694429 RepID=G0EE49_PYRF1|nr:hypothetical protein [Pyrolobus fumarii]AEM37965.1 hypothetical protein Pyrfu_0093 [Pyrolobus fumarii 1A]